MSEMESYTEEEEPSLDLLIPTKPNLDH